MNNTVNALLRSILEAITEFLPISSTGHLFFFSHFFPFSGIERLEEFEDLFDIFIQSGAILSVLVLYFKRFNLETKETFLYILGDKTRKSGFNFTASILIGSFPVLLVGFLLKDFLDGIKSSSYLLVILGVTWFIGGFVILIQEIIFQKREMKIDSLTQSNSLSHNNSISKIEKPTSSEISLKSAFVIGMVQCIALIPGVSRSLATIIAGRSFGLSRNQAAEFSFFLAVPVLIAAGLYKLIKYRSILFGEKLMLLALGSFVSFLLCIIVIRWFLAYIRRHSFSIFGYYRIILGFIVLVYSLT
jgi:undecaprenyl-diphosphatase